MRCNCAQSGGPRPVGNDGLPAAVHVDRPMHRRPSTWTHRAANAKTKAQTLPLVEGAARPGSTQNRDPWARLGDKVSAIPFKFTQEANTTLASALVVACDNGRRVMRRMKSEFLVGCSKQLKLFFPCLLGVSQLGAGTFFRFQPSEFRTAFDSAGGTGILQSERGRQQNRVRPGCNDRLILLLGERSWTVIAARFRQDEQSVRIGRLTNQGAMGRHKKLDVWKITLKPESDFPLPLGRRFRQSAIAHFAPGQTEALAIH